MLFLVRLGARHIVKAAWVPRVTLAQPFRCQCAAAQAAMGLYRLPCVFRAGRVEAALVAYPRAQHLLVQPDGAKQKRFHGNSAACH
ncbi:hypothetical protein AS19_21880 [Alcanivorax sp. NBRC 101098]|nr:hypothetical protein AS19_21880 [Alcanivorax sp. NBRC 101098]